MKALYRGVGDAAVTSTPDEELYKMRGAARAEATRAKRVAFLWSKVIDG